MQGFNLATGEIPPTTPTSSKPQFHPVLGYISQEENDG